MKVGREESKEITTEQAITALVKALKNDADYKHTWQANIAMAVYDSYEPERYGINLTRRMLHKLANDGAKRFLDMLLYINNK